MGAFGVEGTGAGEDGHIDRIRGICTQLGLPDRVIKMLDSDAELDWDATFSQSECQLLSLARAFVGNFEFMVIAKPCQLLAPEQTRSVCKTLLEFVERRGVGM